MHSDTELNGQLLASVNLFINHKHNHKMKKKNLFITNLTKSNIDIKDARAERIAKSAEREQDTLVKKLDKECDDLSNIISDLEDLSPDNELSLHPVKDGSFDAKAWVNDMQVNKVKLANKSIELEIAKKTYATYFTEETAA
jgi:hypothetical protein